MVLCKELGAPVSAVQAASVACAPLHREHVQSGEPGRVRHQVVSLNSSLSTATRRFASFESIPFRDSFSACCLVAPWATRTATFTSAQPQRRGCFSSSSRRCEATNPTRERAADRGARARGGRTELAAGTPSRGTGPWRAATWGRSRRWEMRHRRYSSLPRSSRRSGFRTLQSRRIALSVCVRRVFGSLLGSARCWRGSAVSSRGACAALQYCRLSCGSPEGWLARRWSTRRSVSRSCQPRRADQRV